MEVVIVKSKVKEAAGKFNVAADFLDALNKFVVDTIKSSAKRAEANKRKTVQAKDVCVEKPKAKVMVVVKSKVRDVLKGKNMASDYVPALNEYVVLIINQAKKRAEANGRKTIGKRDL